MEYYNFGSINTSIYTRKDDYYKNDRNDESNRVHFKFRRGKEDNKNVKINNNIIDNIMSNDRTEYDKEFGDLNKVINNLKSKLEETDKIKKKLEEDYTKKISDLQRKLSDKEKNIELSKKIIQEKETKIEKLKERVSLEEDYTKKISDLQRKLSIKEYNIEQSIKTIDEKENKIKKLNETIDSYSKEIDNLKLMISSNKSTLKNLRQYKLIKEVDMSNTISVNEEFIPKYDGQDPLKFYDIIVDISSIKEFVNGWNILKNKIGIENLKQTDESSIKIGVVGNGNKGKSFILSKISDIELPIGESIKTKGLSIKFPKLDNHINRNITLLDSAGQETPVLNNEKNINTNTNINFDNQISNEISNTDSLTEKSRDKLLTEFFLQNYIVKYSDLLIIVVGILTFSEQKLINKIKKTFLKFGKKGQLIVIHNLQSYVTVEQVENYINDTLLKSDTFNLKEEFEISKELTDLENKNEFQWCYYYEPKSSPNTIHLIFAREKSEAGNFYNQKSIHHIYEILNTINEKEPLNLLKNIKDLFMIISGEILETDINENDIECKDDKIKLNITEKKSELKLKKCSIDELDMNHFFTSGFEPKYCYYVNKDMLTIICEIPGEVSDENFNIQSDFQNGKCIIKIEGDKKNDILNLEKECKKIKNTREFGPYNFSIIIEDFNVDVDNGKLEKNDGLIKISYPIKVTSSKLTFKKK